MKALIVAEGKHECGGALESLVRHLVSSPVECTIDRVSREDIHAHHGRGPGYFKKALRSMLEAHKQGFDAIVLVIDQDNQTERVREFDKAQDYRDEPLGTFRRALGVAIRTFDAWMLADQQALSRVLGYSVEQQPLPETINDPKGVCAELLAASSKDMSQTAMYAALGNEAAVEVLEQRCPRGFAPFASRVRQL